MQRSSENEPNRDPLRLFQEAFNKPYLTEKEKLQMRHAAIFAVMTFDSRFLDPEKWNGLNVHYTAEELNLAQDFINNHKPALLATLPAPYNNDYAFHDHAGRYYRLWAKILTLIIPHNLKYGQHEEGSLSDCEVVLEDNDPMFKHPSEKLFPYSTHYQNEHLLVEDPSGRSFVKTALESTEAAMGYRRFKDIPMKLQAEAEFIVADQVYTEVEANPPVKPDRIDFDHDTKEKMLEKIHKLNAWRHYELRERFRNREKANVILSTGHTLDTEGKIVHHTEVARKGTYLAVNQYFSAVELYLSRFGK